MRPTYALCVPCGSDIAIALHTPPHRAVSLALVAQALGATQEKGRVGRSIAALAATSKSSRTSSVQGTPFSLPIGRQKASSAMVITAVEVELAHLSNTQDGV